jgi:hypothetical protein
MELFLEKRKICNSKIYEIPKNIRGLWGSQTYLLNNSTIFGMYDDVLVKGLDGRRGILEYDFISRSYKTYPLLNMSIEPYEAMSQVNVNARTGSLSYDSKSYLLAAKFTPLIEIFSLEDKTLTSINKSSKGLEFVTKFNRRDFENEDYAEAYVHSDTFSNNFYLLFSGISYNQNEDKKIEIIDTRGMLLNTFLIPKKYSISKILIINEETLLGLNQEKDELYIFEI